MDSPTTPCPAGEIFVSHSVTNGGVFALPLQHGTEHWIIIHFGQCCWSLGRCRLRWGLLSCCIRACSCPVLRVNSAALCIMCIPEWLLCHRIREGDTKTQRGQKTGSVSLTVPLAWRLAAKVLGLDPLCQNVLFLCVLWEEKWKSRAFFPVGLLGEMYLAAPLTCHTGDCCPLSWAPGYLVPGSSLAFPLKSICLCCKPGAASPKASWTFATPLLFRRNVCRCKISWSHLRSSSCFGGQLLFGYKVGQMRT